MQTTVLRLHKLLIKRWMSNLKFLTLSKWKLLKLHKMVKVLNQEKLFKLILKSLLKVLITSLQLLHSTVSHFFQDNFQMLNSKLEHTLTKQLVWQLVLQVQIKLVKQDLKLVLWDLLYMQQLRLLTLTLMEILLP